MLRFSANLSFLFLDRPFLDRFAAAAANGFKAVEFHFPYAFPVDEVVDAAHRAAARKVSRSISGKGWSWKEPFAT